MKEQFGEKRSTVCTHRNTECLLKGSDWVHQMDQFHCFEWSVFSVLIRPVSMFCRNQFECFEWISSFVLNGVISIILIKPVLYVLIKPISVFWLDRFQWFYWTSLRILNGLVSTFWLNQFMHFEWIGFSVLIGPVYENLTKIIAKVIWHSNMTSFFRFVDNQAIYRWYNLIRTCAAECDWLFHWQHKLCATFSANVNINYHLPIKVYYRICTLRHIRIEINHGSQNVFWVLTWVGGY